MNALEQRRPNRWRVDIADYLCVIARRAFGVGGALGLGVGADVDILA